MARHDRPTLLLTGGSGLVGHHLRHHKASQDWNLLAPSHRTLDLCDPASVRRYLRDHRPDAVVHAAGRVGGIAANLAEPFAFLAENALMGLNLVTACREAGISQLLNLASSCIYPPADCDGLLHEENLLSGPPEASNEGYAIAKIAVLKLCLAARQEDPALCYKTLIPCNLYGPDDHFDPSRAHLLAAIIAKIDRAQRAGEAEVEIWGDGRARREFLYAGDLAEAIWRALGALTTLPDVMNIGWGVDLAVDDYYQAVAETLGWQGRFRHAPTRPIGVRRKCLDIRRQRDWGWMPSTHLSEGIRATHAHFLRRSS